LVGARAFIFYGIDIITIIKRGGDPAKTQARWAESSHPVIAMVTRVNDKVAKYFKTCIDCPSEIIGLFHVR